MRVEDCEIVDQGKTKIIRQVPGSPNEVFVQNKDDITAGDGASRDVIEDKGVLATTTTVNCFRYLNSMGVYTHFIEQVDPRTFRAHKVQMIRLEIVTRALATGSYLLRNPAVAEGAFLDPLELEFFDKIDYETKDDEGNPVVIKDSLITYDYVREKLLRFHPKKPLREGLLEEVAMTDFSEQIREAHQLKLLGLRTFQELRHAWAQLGVTLVDLKIEGGYLPGTRDLVLADVIDNDSWRLWPEGDKALMVDKQVYRDLQDRSPKDLGKIKDNYQWVATQTGLFRLSTS